MRRARALAPLGLALGALGFALGLAGCGWHTSLAPPPGKSTVAVEIFSVAASPEAVPQRDLEPELHAQISRAVSDLVQARLVPAEAADVIVRGRLTAYRRRGGVRSAENELLESGVRVAVEAWLVDGRTGETIGKHASTARWAGYAVGDVAAEPAARERVMRTLAERLVLDLFGPPRSTGEAVPPPPAPPAPGAPVAPANPPTGGNPPSGGPS